MNFVDRKLGWIYIRHMLMAPAAVIMLLMCSIASFVFYTMLDGRKPKNIFGYALLAVVGIPFLLFDVFFNAVCGTFIFLELPREWLFTQRLERHKKSPYAGPAKYSQWICSVLDYYDPGHCGD